MGCPFWPVGSSCKESRADQVAGAPCRRLGGKSPLWNRFFHDPAVVRRRRFLFALRWRDSLTARRYAALLSVIVACIPPLQAGLDRIEPLRGSVEHLPAEDMSLIF